MKPGRPPGYGGRVLADRGEARRLGDGARRMAQERFSIERFVRDWDRAFRDVTGEAPATPANVGIDRPVEVAATNRPPAP